MAIRITYDPIEAIGKGAQLAGRAEAIKRRQDKEFKAAMQQSQIIATAQGQARANAAAAQRQQARIEASAQANDTARRFLASEKLTDRELALLRDAGRQEGSLDEIAYRAQFARTAAEIRQKATEGFRLEDWEDALLRDAQNQEGRLTEILVRAEVSQQEYNRRKQAESESRRQMSAKQSQRRTTIKQQMADIENDPSYSEEEKPVAMAQLQEELNSMRPQGEIPKTPEDIFKATTYLDKEGNRWGQGPKGETKVLLKAPEAEGGFDDSVLIKADAGARKIVDAEYEDREYAAAEEARAAKKTPIPGPRPTEQDYFNKTMEILNTPQRLREQMALRQKAAQVAQTAQGRQSGAAPQQPAQDLQRIVNMAISDPAKIASVYADANELNDVDAKELRQIFEIGNPEMVMQAIMELISGG